MEENKLAVETGLRAEIAEDFMAGLKNLFVEHYIEVPEDKTDLVEELASQVAAKEEALAEQVAKTTELTKALNESKAVEILRKTTEGLTEVQVAKIKSLAEGVEFTTEGEYSSKLAVIRENYFPTGKKVSEAPKTLVETTDPAEVSPVMDRYVQAISKSLPK
jgi:predicted nuclease with TOPRIM domain